MWTLGLIATAMYIATRQARLEAREAGFLVIYKPVREKKPALKEYFKEESLFPKASNQTYLLHKLHGNLSKCENFQWYFVTKIVLTYCEKNCSSD